MSVSRIGFSASQKLPLKSNPGPLPNPFELIDFKSRAKQERDYAEPTNEELGIVPLDGWKLGAVWLALMAVSIAILIVLGYGLLAILPEAP